MTGLNAMVELKRKAQRKQRRLERLRRDLRYRDVMGAFVRAKLITTNVEVEPRKGPVALKDVLWAGRLEPRLLELLPAVMIKRSLPQREASQKLTSSAQD